MKILLQGRVEGELLQRLESILGDEHTYVAPGSREELIEEGKDAEVYFDERCRIVCEACR